MGAWGTAIFSDDTAADVRGEFRDHIGDGLTPEAATAALVKAYADSIGDMDDGPPFWLGLALTQWNLGRLVPEVRDEALRIIDSGEDLRRWEDDPASLAKRRKVLEDLREKLNSDLPAPKKVPRRFRDSNDWPVGAIVSYRHSDGLLMLFRVIGHHRDLGGTFPVVEVLDWRGTDLPTKWTLMWLKVKIGTHGQRQFMIGALSKRDFPVDRVTVTGIVLKPSQKHADGYTVLAWRTLENDLARAFGGETK